MSDTDRKPKAFDEIYAVHAKHDLDEIYPLLDIWYSTRDQWRAQKLQPYIEASWHLVHQHGAETLALASTSGA